MGALDQPIPPATMPWPLLVADWRRRIAAVFEIVRAAGGGEEAWRLWVETRRALYRLHPASPVPAAEREHVTIEVFPYDAALRVLADVEPCDPAAGAEPSRALTRFGRARFEITENTHALDLHWLETYGNGVFCPFGDATNGDTTYGGGRYLLDTVKGADLGCEGDRLVLDFNFAFAPSCAWDPAWSCPLPPPGNRLKAAIEGGERRPGSGAVGRRPAA